MSLDDLQVKYIGGDGKSKQNEGWEQVKQMNEEIFRANLGVEEVKTVLWVANIYKKGGWRR